MRAIRLLVILTVGCGPAAKHGGDDGTGDPPDADETPIDAPSCGEQMAQIGVVSQGDPPDLLVVLDRSGSMNEPPITVPPTFMRKWVIMRNGLNTVVTSKQSSIKFGVLEFPSDDVCGADATPEVAIALDAAPGFASYLGGRSPGGYTPAHSALTAALAYYNSLPVNMAGRYVLFATDGVPNCLGDVPETSSDTETVAAVKALFDAGIKTYVLGFGTLGFPTGVLNQAALAGGVPRTGLKKFYEANSPAELDAALAAIAGGVIVPSCTFALASQPPDPDNVTVTLDGTAVPRSTMHTDGWDYYPDAMTITFFGSSCATIKSGATTSVNFSYGCPGPIIN